MTHIAIQERLDGKTVNWMEKVSDEQYVQCTQLLFRRSPLGGIHAGTSLVVNGRTHRWTSAEMPLLWVLRDVLKLKGTKFGCGVGNAAPARSAERDPDACLPDHVSTVGTRR